MDSINGQLLLDVVYAVALGFFIGLEREQSERLEPKSDVDADEDVPPVAELALGARTFALIAMIGWAFGFAGGEWPWLPAIGLVLLGALLIAQYFRSADVGLTTEMAAVLTYVAGLLVTHHRGLAIAVGLATVLILVSKPLVVKLVNRMRRVELTATLQLLILLAIVLPLLPAQALDPWGILPPRKIGLFVVLIAGIGFVGYVLSRIFGTRRGAGLTGLVGGLTSSTAVTVAMSKAGRNKAMRNPARLAVYLANAVMFGRVIVVTAVLSSAVALKLAIPMTAMGLVMLAGAYWSWKAMNSESESHDLSSAEVKNPFELLPALQWGAILCVVLIVAYFAQLWFGDAGLFAAAAASGLADVDAITIAVANQAADESLAIDTAAFAISIAVVSNTVVKGGLAVIAGGRSFGRSVSIVFAGAIAVGLIVAIAAKGLL